MSRQITEKEKESLLSLKPDDLTFSCLVGLFGDTTTLHTKSLSNISKSKFNVNDKMDLLPSEYFVKEKTTTTVGIFIFNKYIIERADLQDITGYINFPVTEKGLKKIEGMLSKAFIDEKMTIKQWEIYIDYRDNLGMQLNSVITPSFTPATVSTPKSTEDKKNALFKKYDKELSEGNAIVAEKIEKELLKDVEKVLGKDVGMDLYKSGARGDIGNYKNNNLFKGATMNKTTGKFEILKTSFMDGITKDDLPAFATSVVAGSYPKAVGEHCSPS